jgi:hypothetical protein
MAVCILVYRLLLREHFFVGCGIGGFLLVGLVLYHLSYAWHFLL